MVADAQGKFTFDVPRGNFVLSVERTLDDVKVVVPELRRQDAVGGSPRVQDVADRGPAAVSVAPVAIVAAIRGRDLSVRTRVRPPNVTGSTAS